MLGIDLIKEKLRICCRHCVKPAYFMHWLYLWFCILAAVSQWMSSALSTENHSFKWVSNASKNQIDSVDELNYNTLKLPALRDRKSISSVWDNRSDLMSVLIFKTEIKIVLFCRARGDICALSSYYGVVLHRHAFITTLKPLDSLYHSELRFITTDSHNTHQCMLDAKVRCSTLAA